MKRYAGAQARHCRYLALLNLFNLRNLRMIFSVAALREEMPEIRQTIVAIDASLFQKDVDDPVSAGETLGTLKGEPVIAPFDARIRSISFNSDEHVLQVVLEEVPGKSELV